MVSDADGSVIVHIDLTCSFSEGFTYQENLMPKYHVRMGYEVHFITTTWAWGSKGELECVGEERYYNSDGFEIIRIENDQNKPWDYRLKTHSKLAPLLEELQPDIIFLHCCQVRDSKTVAEYVREHQKCSLYVDNHADYSNSATNWLSKHVLHRGIWRYYASTLIPYAEKFWGVLPARVDFLVENYKIPRKQCELLVMGADDDEVKRALTAENIEATRRMLGFDDDDFVVVTGGKIDSAKWQTLLLMDAVNELPDNVKLLVFGPVSKDLQDAVESRLADDKIIYIPWANASESYDYFSIADVVVFPGRHSVYWEQAAGLGKPLIVKKWAGTQHVDCDGNAVFLESDSVEAIRKSIIMVMNESESFEAAAAEASSEFLYSKISARAIERS